MQPPMQASSSGREQATLNGLLLGRLDASSLTTTTLTPNYQHGGECPSVTMLLNNTIRVPSEMYRYECAPQDLPAFGSVADQPKCAAGERWCPWSNLDQGQCMSPKDFKYTCEPR